MKKTKKKVIKAWADIGSHGGIYIFELGPVANRYPKLFHIYAEKVSNDLIPIEIHIPSHKTNK